MEDRNYHHRLVGYTAFISDDPELDWKMLDKVEKMYYGLEGEIKYTLEGIDGLLFHIEFENGLWGEFYIDEFYILKENGKFDESLKEEIKKNIKKNIEKIA